MGSGDAFGMAVGSRRARVSCMRGHTGALRSGAEPESGMSCRVLLACYVHSWRCRWPRVLLECSSPLTRAPSPRVLGSGSGCGVVRGRAPKANTNRAERSDDRGVVSLGVLLCLGKSDICRVWRVERREWRSGLSVSHRVDLA